MSYTPAVGGRVLIPAISVTAALTGTWTTSQQSGDFFAARRASSAQNDAIGWDVWLDAGTWTLELYHSVGSSRGIYTPTIDGASLTSLGGSADTIDGYAVSSGAAIPPSTITGIVLPAGGKKRLLITMATKNAASSGYLAVMNAVGLIRTA